MHERWERWDESAGAWVAVTEGDPRVKGAQWNEVNGRWERWDEAAAAWIAAVEDE